MHNESAIIKDWRKIDLTVGLIYPNVYKIGMSCYAIRLLYFLINSHENYVCERIFLPEKIMFPASEDTNSVEVIRSVENKIHPIEFDILGISVQFENDYRNILWILDKAGIPLTYKERLETSSSTKKIFPLVIGGGPVITSNPQPFSEIFDLLFIGDSEPNLELLFQSFLKYKFNKINFQEFLGETIKIDGIYVPSYNNNAKRVVLKNLDDSPTPHYQLISNNLNYNTIFENRYFIEVNRGCPFQCKFCISSYHNAPFRNKSYEKIIKDIDEGIQFSNFNTISLIGSCVSAHPRFIDICQYILNKGIKFTIPSIRVDHINQKILQLLEKANIKSVTIAPETGSERLRYELGKCISNDSIFQTLQTIKDSHIKKVKFYFLIGLPNETEREINDLINFILKINEIGFERDSLRVNVNPLVPKLNTPYEKIIDSYLNSNFKSLFKKYEMIEQNLRKIPSIKLKFRNIKEILNNAKLQALISVGDQNISNFLIRYYYNGANFGGLRRSEKETDISINDYFLKVKECYSFWKI